MVIAAGYEAAYSANACGNHLHGHRYVLTGSEVPTVDGVTVRCRRRRRLPLYGEAHCDGADPGATHRATMSVATSHEFGHDLGLPDYYSNGGDPAGVGDYSLMSTGTWLGDLGTTPALPDAFSRTYGRWTTPAVLHGTSTVAVPAASSSPTVWEVLGNPNGIDWSSDIDAGQRGTGEYFLIENRTKTRGTTPACPGAVSWSGG